jgi:hypothetical protein
MMERVSLGILTSKQATYEKAGEYETEALDAAGFPQLLPNPLTHPMSLQLALLSKLTFQPAAPGVGSPGPSSLPSTLCQRPPEIHEHILCP